MKKFLPLLSLALCACSITIEGITPPPAPTPVEGETEEVGTQDVDALMFENERLLPTGAIEVGDENAPAMLVVFTEHHCTYCSDFERTHLPMLSREFIDTGKLKLQIIPVTLKKYPNSEIANRTLLCSALQGKGMQMHSLLLAHLPSERSDPTQYAAELEIDETAFNECVNGQQSADLIAVERAVASSFDVTLVPTLFLNGEKYVGLPYEADLRGMVKNATLQ